MLEKVNVQTSKKIKWVQKHKPISVSIASNVEDFVDPKCFVNPDLDVLLSDMIEYMTCISDKARTLVKQNFEAVFRQLNTLLESYCGTMQDDDDDDIYDVDRTGTLPPSSTNDNNDDDDPHRYIRRDIRKHCSRFALYCNQIPVLSFNGARYDLNLVKEQLAAKLELNTQKNSFVIKKCNSYTVLSNDTFRFLDVTNYLAAGCSYSKFLEAFGATIAKGYFCYEFFDEVSKLDYKELPPYSCFYSSLKQINLLNTEGKGQENYIWLQEQWKHENMQSLKDLLIWYNNRDCIGFVQAVN